MNLPRQARKDAVRPEIAPSWCDEKLKTDISLYLQPINQAKVNLKNGLGTRTCAVRRSTLVQHAIDNKRVIPMRRTRMQVRLTALGGNRTCIARHTPAASATTASAEMTPETSVVPLTIR
jgi:hypothetical protein